ncbi:MAG: transposase [Pyrinomonadaceae bacterium]
MSEETKAWAAPLKELLLEMKGAAEREGAQVPAWQLEKLTARYDRLVAEGQEEAPPPDVPQSACRQARNLLRRLKRRKEEVLRFLSDPAVPFDNNLAERDLRMVKLQQKVSGCIPHAGRRATVLPHQELRLDRSQAGARGAASAQRGVPREAAQCQKTQGVAERLLLINDLTQDGASFDTETNVVTLLTRDREQPATLPSCPSSTPHTASSTRSRDCTAKLSVSPDRRRSRTSAPRPCRAAGTA